MSYIIAPSSTQLRSANTYTRVAAACGRETNQQRHERLSLANFAYTMGRHALVAPPRLIRQDIRSLECLSLSGMLQSHPAYDALSVEL